MSPSPSARTEKPRDPTTTSRIMAAVRRRDTGPELRLRRYLFARGLRYRVDDKRLPGRPDVVFSGARVAVFVDGDFWHGKDSAARLHSNRSWWEAKIAGNVARDQRVTADLTGLGWQVVRVYASELDADLAGVADRITALVSCRSSPLPPRG